MAKSKKSKQISFEEALEELEEITRQLEGGALSLDESIKAYEQGMELKKICQDMLEHAERKLEFLEKQENGEIEKKPIEAGETEDRTLW